MSKRVVLANEITDNDVLLGRGKAIHIHEGNIRFRRLVKERAVAQLPPGCAGNVENRREDAIEVLKTIRLRGGRFLKASDSEQQKEGDTPHDWEAVDIEVALAKVKQALRDSRSKKERKRKAKIQSESEVVCPPRRTEISTPPTSRSLKRNSEPVLPATSANSLERPSHLRENPQRLRLLALLQEQQQVRRLEERLRLRLAANHALDLPRVLEHSQSGAMSLVQEVRRGPTERPLVLATGQRTGPRWVEHNDACSTVRREFEQASSLDNPHP